MERIFLAIALFLTGPIYLLGQDERIEISSFQSLEIVAPSELPGLPYQRERAKVPNYLPEGQNIYLKLTLVGNTKIEKGSFLLLSYALLDTLTFYAQGPEGVSLVLHTGQAKPFQSRSFPSSDFVLPLESGINTYYLRVQSAKPMVIPLQIMEEETLIGTLTTYDFLFGAYAGIVLVMLLYNLVLHFVTRDSSYLYYVLYLGTLLLAQSSLYGYSDRFLFPNSPEFGSSVTVLSGALVGIASVAFIIKFLNLRERSPLYYRLLLAVVVLDIIGIVLLYSGLESVAYQMVNGVALSGSIVAILAGIKLVRQGYKPATFFLLAWTIFLISVVIFAMKDFELLPYNAVLRRSMLFGSTLEIILLSVALADRINQFRREKEESQAKALKMSRENERLIREQNVELEKRVQERTMELQETNEELQVTLENLKDTQTQLVDAEKMASLGQLTAGIAHEINNPINFITSNIKPLEQDLSEVYEIVEAFSSLSPECSKEQLEAARELLEDYDYEYLRNEIKTLVQGISDGADRTSEIVRGLRTFSRLDEDVVKLANLNEGLDSTLVLLKNKTKDNLEVLRDYDDQLDQVECFPGKLNQAFMNILNNAIYAVEKKQYPEGVRPTITLKTRNVDADWVSIHLIDNGIGMDEQTQRKLFEPFFTTKDVGEGTGLGMSIVFKIVDKHGGKIVVNSTLGEGTEFIITLPKQQPSEFK